MLSNNEPNSLKQHWNLEKQSSWQSERKKWIEKGIEYLKTKPDFDSFYNFNAKARHKIAKKLNQNDMDKLGILRVFNYKTTPWETAIFDKTGSEILNGTPYSDFYSYLHALFEAIDIKKDCSELCTLTPYVSGFWEFPNKTAASYVQVQFDGFNYTKISCFDAKTVEGIKVQYMLLNHVSDQKTFDKVRETLSNLYGELQDNEYLSPLRKCRIIKDLMWHQAHGMLCERGSAAILEVITEILLAAHEIEWNAIRPKVPLDLIAIFSPTPELFAQSIIINEIIETKSLITERNGMIYANNKSALFKSAESNIIEDELVNSDENVVRIRN